MKIGSMCGWDVPGADPDHCMDIVEQRGGMEIQYGSNGMPDVGADGMYYNAGRNGSIETMPDTPGLAVWKSGHIGVYIGNGEVIEAMDTRYGVVKTKLQGRGWTHWLEVPEIKYD